MKLGALTFAALFAVTFATPLLKEFENDINSLAEESNHMEEDGADFVAVDGSDNKCQQCMAIWVNVRKYIKTNKTQAQIYMRSLCDLVVHAEKAACVYFFNAYYNVISMDMNSFSNREWCSGIHLCSAISPLKFTNEHQVQYNGDLIVNADQQLATKVSIQDMFLPPHQQSQDVCHFCMSFLSYFGTRIADPKMEHQIENIILKACSELPIFSEVCSRVGVELLKDLLTMLASQINPTEACNAIKACPAEEVKDMELVASTSVKCPLFCGICVDVIQTMDSLISDPTSKECIKTAEKIVCSVMPELLRPWCNFFVNSFSDLIVEAIAKGLKPKETCAFVGFCASQSPRHKALSESKLFGEVVATNAISEHQAELNNAYSCGICKSALATINELLNNEKHHKDIKKLAQEICNAVPAPMKDFCDDYVHMYGESAIVLAKEFLESDDVCPMLGFCPKKP